MSRTSDAEQNGAKLCFSTLGCSELELEAALGLGHSHGIGAIELRGLGGTLDLPAYLETRFSTPDQLKDLLRGQPVAVVAMDTSVEAASAGPGDRKELLDLLPWALAAGTPRIRVFDGGETGSEAELAGIASLLSWWEQQNESLSRSPSLMVETHNALALPEALRRFCTLCPNASILWDTHHTWHEGGELPSLTWQLVRGMCQHIHIKDSMVDENGSLAYVAPGEGVFPHLDLLEVLAGDAYSGFVSLEWERHWFPTLPPIKGPLSRFVALYKANLARLA